MEAIFPKLPVWFTVKNSYRLAWANRWEYFKISRWWLLLGMPMIYAYHWLTWNISKNVICHNSEQFKSNPELQKQSINDGLTSILFSIPPAVFLLLLGASIAVAWHRLILRGEHVTDKRYLRLDNVVMNYFAFGVFLWVLSILPVFFGVIGIVTESAPNTQSAPNFGGIIAVTIGMLIAAIIILVVSIRLSIILPAIALKENATIKDVWQRTSWNFWRLSTGDFVCALPAMIISFLLTRNCQNEIVDIGFYTLNLFINVIVTMPLCLTFLSLSYSHFFEKPQYAEFTKRPDIIPPSH